LQAKKEELLAKAQWPAREAMRLHPCYRGKIQTLPKCPIRGLEDFSLWYSPGVAAPCRAIRENPQLVYELTNKANSIAIVSDGTRVLGLGDIGPEAGLPVMEGKALLFKYLGGVDATPICLGSTDPAEIIRAVKILEPSFGAINLEDIAQPKCFHVLDALRARLRIPVWHDDQQGSATVVLAALINAARLVGKPLKRLKLALVGMGAANVATYRLLRAYGLDMAGTVACDSKGTLHPGRADIAAQQRAFPDKWRICSESNAEGIVGGIEEALRGADACVAFAAPGIISGKAVAGMARDAILLACANPVPEIWPWEAKAAGVRIVGTGRGDLPNQINNSLCFPGIFRGLLDARASTISDGMTIAAAKALAAAAGGSSDERLLPTMAQWKVAADVAAATAAAATAEGLAQLPLTYEEERPAALAIIANAREATRLLMDGGTIPAVPPAAP
jgi:malate dehydrogenase (oxaloacetate-decarboxylating)